MIDEGAAAGIVEDIDDDRDLTTVAALRHAVVIADRHRVVRREEVRQEVAYQVQNAAM